MDDLQEKRLFSTNALYFVDSWAELFKRSGNIVYLRKAKTKVWLKLTQEIYELKGAALWSRTHSYIV